MDIFRIKNITNNNIELKTLGIIIHSGETLDVIDENSIRKSEEIEYLKNNNVIQRIHNSSGLTNEYFFDYFMTGLTTERFNVNSTIIFNNLKKTSTESDITFGTPLSTPLPSINTSYSQPNIQVLGINGPVFTNVSNFSINWDLNNNGLYTFSISTNDGNPYYYKNLIPNITQNFNQTSPSLNINNSGFTGLDGDYWVNKINSNFFMVSKNVNFTILLGSNNSYIPAQYDVSYLVIDNVSNEVENSTIKANVYGSEFNYTQDESISTTNSTSPQTKLTLNVIDLPLGRYKISVNWGFSHNSTSNSALFDIQINNETQGQVSSIETKDNTDVVYQNRIFYKILSGNNTITLRYWNEGSSTNIFDTSIELIRVE